MIHLLYIWISRTSASLSILGSSAIVYMILSDRKRKLDRPYHRLMLMMSSFDIIQSVALAVAVLAIPRESDFYGAKGNIATCKAQGFFLVLGGFAVPLYNSCLNVYYVLTIRYNISLQKFVKFEPILHVFSILYPTVLATILTADDKMVPVMAGRCSPRGSLFSLTFALTLGSCFFISFASMICICWTVISQGMAMKRYNFGNGRNSFAQRRETTIQALVYMLAFILTHTFPLIGFLATKEKVGEKPRTAFLILACILYPLQGFWNFLFYIRPGVRRVIRANPDISRLGAMRIFVFCRESALAGHIGSPGGRRLSTPVLPSNQVVRNDVSPSTSPLFLSDDPHAGEITTVKGLNNVTEKGGETEAGTMGLPSTTL